MPDPRFFTVAGPFTLQKLAAIASAEIGPGTDPDTVFTDKFLPPQSERMPPKPKE